MVAIYEKVFVQILPYIIPMIVIIALVNVWAVRTAKKKQQASIDSIKSEIANEVVEQINKDKS